MPIFYSGSAVVRRVVILCLLFLPCLEMIAEPTIWFAPQDPVNRPSQADGSSHQYMELFEPGAAWAEAAKRVGVFILSREWLRQASDEQLRQQFSDLSRRGIALAWETGPLTRSNDCATGVEGEGSSRQNLAVGAQRIRNDGGDLKYIVMDEPLFYSGLAPDSRCSWTVDRVASDAANNIKGVKAIFPNVQVGDVEPVGSDKMPVQQQLARYRAGIEAFQRALGTPLAFFHLDLLWHVRGLTADLKEAKAMVESEHIPMGVIYDGSSKSTSDDEWLRLTEQHVQLVESTIGPPAMVIFQSWHAYPKKLLPESDPDAFTYLLREYHPR